MAKSSKEVWVCESCELTWEELPVPAICECGSTEFKHYTAFELRTQIEYNVLHMRFDVGRDRVYISKVPERFHTRKSQEAVQ